MKLFYLKKLRIFVSVLFLILTAVLFLDISNIIPTRIFDYVTFLQFVPSVLKFFSSAVPFAAGFIFITLITFLFGRIYCSTICPLGTLQDIVSFISRKNRKRKKYIYSKEHSGLRYSILALTLFLLLAGNTFLLIILDPYSNTGRIFSQLLNPAVIFVNNIAAFILEKFNIYLIYPVEVKAFYTGLLLFPLIFLGIVVYMSYYRGRLYCNTVCPVGTLLGLISRFTVFKLKIDKASCEGCGVCANVCKAECIDKKGKTIDFSRCIACYNCLNVCPSDSINYMSGVPINARRRINGSRRNFLNRTSVVLSGLAASAFAQIKVVPQKKSTVEVKKNSFVSPPGSGSVKNFTDNCTACHLCVSACPTKVLQPSFNEWGVFGILQPFMDFNTSYCNYDCKACTEVCPTGAIYKISAGQKKSTQLGRAVFVKENCIVETEKTACGACSEHCPTKAVIMVDYRDGLKIPEVTNKYCVGCGACEYACPVRPYKAIYVDGNLYHQIAEKKPVEKIEQKIDYKEEFPF